MSEGETIGAILSSSFYHARIPVVRARIRATRRIVKLLKMASTVNGGFIRRLAGRGRRAAGAAGRGADVSEISMGALVSPAWAAC